MFCGSGKFLDPEVQKVAAGRTGNPAQSAAWVDVGPIRENSPYYPYEQFKL